MPEAVVLQLMMRFGLASYDAIHAATAMHAGVKDFVTSDVGFAKVPERHLVLQVVRSRVKRCRDLRKQASWQVNGARMTSVASTTSGS